MGDKSINLEDLTPDPKNARKHGRRNLDAIEAALKDVGAARSVVIDEHGTVLAGNATIEAAKAAGLSKLLVVDTDGQTVVAVRRTGLSEDEKTRLALYDNRAGELAEWDQDALKSLAESGVDLGKMWTEEELSDLLGIAKSPGRTDPDAVPPERATSIQPGDLFELGRHLLLCGDATDADDIARLSTRGDTPSVLLTDPPYGMQLDTDWSDVIGSIGRQRQTSGNKYAPVIGDDKPFDPSHLFVMFERCREMFLWGADYYAERITDRTDGSWLVWDKRKESQADAIGAEFELCWSKVKHKRRVLRPEWFGFLSSQNGQDARHRVHPTQKPVSLLVDILQQWGRAGDVVADVYAGSGSTLIACEQLGFGCLAIEMSPPYVQVIIDRWEQFTGKKAVKVA